MEIVYRPIERWPGDLTKVRRRSDFTAKWHQTLALLEREIRAIDGKNVVFQIALEERDFRIDGQPRAHARAAHPGVILTLDSKWGPLQYPCDSFWEWQDNVRAIALALEALRKVDRYGVTAHGEQYTGWKQIGTGTALGSGDTPMTVDEAARVLADACDGLYAPAMLIDQVERRKDAYRRAAQKHHPDVGGEEEAWRLIDKAKRVLEAHA